MTEWRLFPEGEPPRFTTLGFFTGHPWIPPAEQAGHAERTGMVAGLVRNLVLGHYTVDPPEDLSDLGCGDGSLLELTAELGVPQWGYDAGTQNVAVARGRSLGVRQADVLDLSALEVADLATACDVVEHLADPHGWLAGIPSRLLVASSPSAETGEWHYEHHAWAWDVPGYRALVEGAGWRVVDHVRCEAPPTSHGGETRTQWFQAVVGVRL